MPAALTWAVVRGPRDLLRVAEATVGPWVPVWGDAAGGTWLGPVLEPGLAGCARCLADHMVDWQIRAPSAHERSIASWVKTHSVDGGLLWAGALESGSPGLGFHPFLADERCACVERVTRPDGGRTGVLRLVSRLFGPIGSVDLERASTEGWWVARARGSQALGPHLVGLAADRVPENALVRAIGEVAELIGAASAGDVLPSRSPGVACAAWQGWGPWSDGDPDELAWIIGERLATGARVQVPAAAVRLPWSDRSGAPTRSVLGSEGLGAGCARTEAIRHGLLEVIEREVLRRSWLRVPPASRLDSSLDGAAVLGVHRGAFTVAAWIQGDEPPWLSLGFGAGEDPKDAAQRAEREAVLVRHELAAILRRVGPSAAPSGGSLDVELWFAAADRRHAMQILGWLNQDPIPFERLPVGLEIRDDLIAVDLTPRSWGGAVQVVRVLVEVDRAP